MWVSAKGMPIRVAIRRLLRRPMGLAPRGGFSSCPVQPSAARRRPESYAAGGPQSPRFCFGRRRMNTRQFAAHGAKQPQQALLGQRRYLDLDESGPSDGRFNGFATQFANKPPSANSCGRVVSANSWRGTFCELQLYSVKCFVKKKFPAKALGGEVSLAGNFSSPALVDYKCVAKPRSRATFHA